MTYNHWANFNQSWHKVFLDKGNYFFTNEEPLHSHKEIHGFFILLLINIMIIICVWFELGFFSGKRCGLWGLLFFCQFMGSDDCISCRSNEYPLSWTINLSTIWQTSYSEPSRTLDEQRIDKLLFSIEFILPSTHHNNLI